jgi:hypothetical protein
MAAKKTGKKAGFRSRDPDHAITAERYLALCVMGSAWTDAQRLRASFDANGLKQGKVSFYLFVGRMESEGLIESSDSVGELRHYRRSAFGLRAIRRHLRRTMEVGALAGIVESKPDREPVLANT